MSIPMMFQDGIETVGIVKRIYIHLIFCDDSTGQCEWHYFGTDPATKPPPAGWDQWPIQTHLYIQLPEDLDDLSGTEADQLLYDIGRLIAGRISGYESIERIKK